MHKTVVYPNSNLNASKFHHFQSNLIFQLLPLVQSNMDRKDRPVFEHAGPSYRNSITTVRFCQTEFVPAEINNCMNDTITTIVLICMKHIHESVCTHFFSNTITLCVGGSVSNSSFSPPRKN